MKPKTRFGMRAVMRLLPVLVVLALVLSLAGCASPAAPASPTAAPVAPTAASAAPTSAPATAPATPASQAAAGGSKVFKIGTTSTTEGPFAVFGPECFRGIEMAVAEVGGKVGDYTIQVIKEGTDVTPDQALKAAKKLIEQENVDILIGPLSGDQGLAIKEYARSKPNKTFFNGVSSSQMLTVRNPAPNLFNYYNDGAMTCWPMGQYAMDKGYKRIAILSEDYSFPYDQVGGFLYGYCNAGGKVVKKFWVPLGTKDFSSVVSQMPKDIDAIYCALGGSDAINFLKQYDEFGGKAPLIGGAIFVDAVVLGVKGALADRVLGTPSSQAFPDEYDLPAYQKWVAEYKAKYPDSGFPNASLYSYGYYMAAKAALQAFKDVNGDLSDGQVKFRQALEKNTVDGPLGPIKLNKNHKLIGTSFITEVAKKPDGTLYNKTVKVIPNVTETLGEDPAKYEKQPEFSRDYPSCP